MVCLVARTSRLPQKERVQIRVDEYEMIAGLCKDNWRGKYFYRIRRDKISASVIQIIPAFSLRSIHTNFSECKILGMERTGQKVTTVQYM